MKRPRRDIVVPPDNYSSIDRQMLRLRAIPAQIEAERLIAEKFGMEYDAGVETTGIFDGNLSPEMRREAAAQEIDWEQWEDQMSQPPRQSFLSRMFGWMTGRAPDNRT